MPTIPYNNIITVENFTISYQQVHSAGALKIFFIHGNSNSGNLWVEQFSSPILKNFDRIAIDLPGHGNSSFSDNLFQDYSVQGLAKHIYKAIALLAKETPFILCGFSLGSNIVAELLPYLKDAKGIILISPSIVGGGITPQDLNDNPLVGQVLYSSDVSEQLLDSYIDLAFAPESHELRKQFKLDFRRCDPEFRRGLIESAIAGAYSDEVGLINDSNLPCLIISGNNDPVITKDIYERPGLFNTTTVQYQLIDGLHYLTVEMAKEVNSLIADFISKSIIDNPVLSRTSIDQ